MVTPAESQPAPYIFFSYARADFDAYLERFFADLSKRSAQVLGLGDATVAFIDTASIRTGEDWNTRIAGALQVSKVLVCVYSPNFFSKERTHEYCAKEFDAFLRRHPDLRYESFVEGDRTIIRIRDARNIVPILWLGELDLAPQGLPPSIVGAITYTLNKLDSRFSEKLNKAYKSNGMEQFARRRGATYWEIIAALARLIRDYASSPLPPTPTPPEFTTLRNAFWDPPPGATAPVDPLTSASVEQQITQAPGPGHLVSIQIRPSEGVGDTWIPYAGEQSLSGTVQEVSTSRRLACVPATLDPTDPEFLNRARQVLAAATAANTSVILFVHPQCLEKASVRNSLANLFAIEKWRGGVMIPVDGSDQALTELVAGSAAFFQLPLEQQERIAMKVTVGSSTDFRLALTSLLDEVLARIVKHGNIQAMSPNNDGPLKRPNITNVTNVRSSDAAS